MLVLLALVVVTLLLIAFVMPIPRGFSVRASYLGSLSQCPSFLAVTIPEGDSVSFHWSTPSTVEFGIWNCASGDRIVYENGTSGSGAFISRGGSYGFSSICGYGGYACPPANVSGTFSGPFVRL